MIKVLEKYLDHPAFVYSLIWIVILLIDRSVGSVFSQTIPLTFFHYLIFLGAGLSFVLGALFFTFSKKQKKDVFSFVAVDKKILKKTIFFWSIGVLSFFIEFFYYKKLPLFSHSLEDLRREFGFFGIHLLTNSTAITGSLLFSLFWFCFPEKKFSRIKAIFVAFLTLSIFVFLTYILSILCFIFLIFFYWWQIKNKNPLLLIFFLSFCLIFLIGFLFLREHLYYFFYSQNRLFFYNYIRPSFSSRFYFLANPYAYLCVHFHNFAFLVNSWNNFNFLFIETLKPLWALFLIKDYFQDTFGIYSISQNQPFSFYNTYTYLKPYWIDFGFFGVFFFPFVLGATVAFFYKKMKEFPHILNIFIYGFFLFGVFCSFFDNLYIQLNFWLPFLFLFLIKYKIKI